MLQKELENRGHKVFYFHAITFSIANILNVGKKRSSSGKTADIAHASSFAISLRKVALLTDLIRFRFLVTRLSHQKYDYILSDRYFFDMIVNIAYLSHKKYIPFFLHIMVMPTHAFFLSVDPEKIIEREDAPTQGIFYLKEKNDIYIAYKNVFPFAMINGDRDQSVISTEILSTILPKKL